MDAAPWAGTYRLLWGTLPGFPASGSWALHRKTFSHRVMSDPEGTPGWRVHSVYNMAIIYFTCGVRARLLPLAWGRWSRDSASRQRAASVPGRDAAFGASGDPGGAEKDAADVGGTPALWAAALVSRGGPRPSRCAGLGGETAGRCAGARRCSTPRT